MVIRRERDCSKALFWKFREGDGARSKLLLCRAVFWGRISFHVGVFGRRIGGLKGGLIYARNLIADKNYSVFGFRNVHGFFNLVFTSNGTNVCAASEKYTREEQ